MPRRTRRGACARGSPAAAAPARTTPAARDRSSATTGRAARPKAPPPPTRGVCSCVSRLLASARYARRDQRAGEARFLGAHPRRGGAAVLVLVAEQVQDAVNEQA